MLKDIETQLLQAKHAQNSPEANKKIIDELVRQLPEKNSQGEIKDTVNNDGTVEQLATVELSETHMTYLKYGDRQHQKDGLRIVAALDGSSIETETIARDGELEETP